MQSNTFPCWLGSFTSGFCWSCNQEHITSLHLFLTEAVLPTVTPNLNSKLLEFAIQSLTQNYPTAIAPELAF